MARFVGLKVKQTPKVEPKEVKEQPKKEEK
jgi:hypothetical protein